MPADRKVLAIGNSHLQRIECAYQEFSRQSLFNLRFVQLNDEKYKPWITRIGEKFLLNSIAYDDIIETIKDFSPDCVFLTIGGNEHFVHGAIKDVRDFDFYLPDRPDLAIAPGVEVVPYQLVKNMLALEIKGPLETMAFITEHVDDVYCLSAPPAVRDSAFFTSSIPPEMLDSTSGNEVVDAQSRYKFWRICQDCAREWTEGNRIQFLAPPSETVDPEGFIVDTYRGDAFHGNTWYGDRVLLQMSDTLSNKDVTV